MKEIPLTQGKVALVDDEDFEALKQFKWCAAKFQRVFYAVRNYRNPKTGKKSTIKMHRQILGLTNPEEQIDHKNGNGLDNRRTNLRVCSAAENGMNRGAQANNKTGFKGVTSHRKKYRAQIISNGKYIHIGVFQTAELAAAAYDAAALKYYGEFARTNF